MLKKWDDLPPIMQNDKVRYYYDILQKKWLSLLAKRIFDILIAVLMLIALSPVFLIISVAIKIDSQGPVMFRQVRVTQYGRQFKIFKFRTMVDNAENMGSQITVKNDSRVTRVGRVLRKYRLDEIPQLLNIILGQMSFVGTRPEVVKYVEKYTDEMMATLLLPAGVTSEASIQYKDEELLLSITDAADETYLYEVLPEKMKYNLENLEEFNFFIDIKMMIRTVIAMVKKSNSIEVETKVSETMMN